MARVKLDRVRKVYENGYTAVHDVSLEIADGEFVVLVGPSGCGKSTTLRMIAGLESISGGELWIGDLMVNGVAPSERDIAMVFQNYALYPHMSVRDNMAFSLKMRKLSKPQIEERVRAAAVMLGIEELLGRTPRQLSGGQRQRVAVGRALVRQPQAFLFDEPLSNLDAKLRAQTRKEISLLHRQLGATMIYVTHDQTEAMTMGDRIVVLNRGYVQQVGTPLEVYDRPANLFVAGFIGSPAMNLILGRITRNAGLCFRSAAGDFSLPLPDDAAGLIAESQDGTVVLGIRPENIHLAGRGPADRPLRDVELQLDVVEPMGSETLLYARTAGQEIVARVEPHSVPEPGRPIRLGIDVSALHLFDPETGTRLDARLPCG